MLKYLDDMHKLRQTILPLLVSLPSIMAISGSVVYFIYGLNIQGAWAALGLSVLALIVIYKIIVKERGSKQLESSPILHIDWLLFFTYLLLWAIAAAFLIK